MSTTDFDSFVEKYEHLLTETWNQAAKDEKLEISESHSYYLTKGVDHWNDFMEEICYSSGDNSLLLNLMKLYLT